MKIIEIIMFISILICSYTDIKKNKILNIITFPLIGTGFILNTFMFGTHGLISSLIGILVSYISVSIVSVLVNNIGFGDLKLFMGVGSCMGWNYFLSVYIISILLFLIVRILENPKIFRQSFDEIKSIFTTILISKKLNRIEFSKKSKTFAFAPYILIGSLISTILIDFYKINIINFLL